MPFSNVRGKKLCMELVNDKNERHTGVKLIEGSLSQNIKIKIVLKCYQKKKKSFTLTWNSCYESLCTTSQKLAATSKVETVHGRNKTLSVVLRFGLLGFGILLIHSHRRFSSETDTDS